MPLFGPAHRRFPSARRVGRWKVPFGTSAATYRGSCQNDLMPAPHRHIRVKAMLIAPNRAGTHHAVSVNNPTIEDPNGFHRLIGGGVEFGETDREAIVREVREELGAEIRDLTYLATIENIFRINDEPGHEIVAVYTGYLDPEPASAGATLTESDGMVVPVSWRRLDGAAAVVPLYPSGIQPWVSALLGASDPREVARDAPTAPSRASGSTLPPVHSS